jgi:D-alanyl-D-alanine carboxypeptidase (penicillin-binding protein 5/6)
LIKEFPDFYPWFSQKSFEFNAINQNNRNRLLWQDTSVDGLKTGFTKNSGYSIAASALRDDTRLIAVVMGTNSPETRTESTQRLLNYGFRFFETRQLFSAKNPIENIELIDGDIKEVPVGLSEDFLLSFPKGQYARLITQFDINHPVIAPIRQGQVLGKLVIKLGKKTLAERPLVALVDVKENHLIGRVWHTITDSIDSFGSQ